MCFCIIDAPRMFEYHIVTPNELTTKECKLIANHRFSVSQCAECHGIGVIYATDDGVVIPASEATPVSYKELCEECSGTGIILVLENGERLW